MLRPDADLAWHGYQQSSILGDEIRYEKKYFDSNHGGAGARLVRAGLGSG